MVVDTKLETILYQLTLILIRNIYTLVYILSYIQLQKPFYEFVLIPKIHSKSWSIILIKILQIVWSF